MIKNTKQSVFTVQSSRWAHAADPLLRRNAYATTSTEAWGIWKKIFTSCATMLRLITWRALRWRFSLIWEQQGLISAIRTVLMDEDQPSGHVCVCVCVSFHHCRSTRIRLSSSLCLRARDRGLSQTSSRRRRLAPVTAIMKTRLSPQQVSPAAKSVDKKIKSDGDRCCL